MCDCEPADFCEHSTPTARKKHRCYECGSFVVPGRRHHYYVGKWHGDFETFRVCESCEAIRDGLEAHIKCCVGFGELQDSLSEEFLSRERTDLYDPW